jgi:hypothetical protein
MDEKDTVMLHSRDNEQVNSYWPMVPTIGQ